MDGVIARTGERLELLSIQYGNSAVHVFERASTTKRGQGQVNGGSSSSHHLCEEILRKRKLVTAGAIVGHQQPASATLLNGVQPIASARLHNLTNKCVKITMDQPRKILFVTEELIETACTDDNCLPRNLKDGSPEGTRYTH